MVSRRNRTLREASANFASASFALFCKSCTTHLYLTARCIGLDFAVGNLRKAFKIIEVARMKCLVEPALTLNLPEECPERIDERGKGLLPLKETYVTVKWWNHVNKAGKFKEYFWLLFHFILVQVFLLKKSPQQRWASSWGMRWFLAKSSPHWGPPEDWGRVAIAGNGSSWGEEEE